MDLYCTPRCCSFLLVHLIFWLLILIARCIFKKSFATFWGFSYLCNNDVAGRKEAVEQADTNQDFSSPEALLSLVQDWSRWKKAIRFSLHVQTKKINLSVIYRKASSDQEVWWERAIWAISDPGKDFDGGKLHSSMWNLFHMEERVVLPQYSCSQGVKKRMGDVMRDLPQASEPLCATELLLGKANQASLQLSARDLN